MATSSDFSHNVLKDGAHVFIQHTNLLAERGWLYLPTHCTLGQLSVRVHCACKKTGLWLFWSETLRHKSFATGWYFNPQRRSMVGQCGIKAQSISKHGSNRLSSPWSHGYMVWIHGTIYNTVHTSTITWGFSTQGMQPGSQDKTGFCKSWRRHAIERLIAATSSRRIVILPRRRPLVVLPRNSINSCSERWRWGSSGVWSIIYINLSIVSLCGSLFL